MGGIRVVARIRPQQTSELDRDCIVSSSHADGDTSSQPTLVRIPSFKNENEVFSFQFSSVYDETSTQQAIFDNETDPVRAVTPTIKHLFHGFDVTIFAYGVTGTGKTHTMRGGKSLADRGIIPRLLSSTYRRCRKVEKDSAGKTSVGITLSYYEIYNDKVFDLLEAPEKRTQSGLHLRDNGGKTVVVGLTERPCENLKEFEKIYDLANVNRSTSATKLNAHSSRSHAVLCFKLTMTTGDEVRVSTASESANVVGMVAIDLAGSEDNRRTDNGKERLVESASINKSLFVLAKCVEAISQNQARVPYRESKMTRILSLGQNNGLTVMILNLAPSRSYHLDTISSLNFANRTKKIEVREIENEPISKGCSRAVSSATGSSMQRQPLRSLASTLHNTAMGPKPSSKQQDKPAKTFSVYSDRPKNPSMSAHAARDTNKRSSPLKRPSEVGSSAFSRPAKRRSPERGHRPSGMMSKEAIEDMIEKKVSNILATRTIDHTTSAPVPEISEDVQRRLELLEQKIDGHDDGREQGLTFLLMAKQHAVRGEDRSALRMFLLARDYFPDNAKLTMKIEKLQSKLKGRESSKENLDAEARTDVASREKAGRPKRKEADVQDMRADVRQASKSAADDDYRDRVARDSDGEYDSSDSFRYRPKKAKGRKKAATSRITMPGRASDPQATSLRLQAAGESVPRVTPGLDSVAMDGIGVAGKRMDETLGDGIQTEAAESAADGAETPRTKQLLSIINSRDVGRIRLLQGVGARRAEAMVEALCGGSEEGDGSCQVVVQSLAQLGHLRGVGVKTVERMRSGLNG
ncbi:MAG: hypothetical protein Q9200_004793 [Gallowayella weberi]